MITENQENTSVITKTRASHRMARATPVRRTRRVFTRCPICGGELQATLEDYAKQVVLSETGELVDYQDAGCGEVCVYCENGHTEHEMLRAKKMRQANSRQ